MYPGHLPSADAIYAMLISSCYTFTDLPEIRSLFLPVPVPEITCHDLLIASRNELDIFKFERLPVQFGSLIQVSPFPGCDIGKLVIVAQCLTFRCLEFLPKVTATGFLPMARIGDDEFCHFHEIGHAIRFLEFGIEIITLSR